MQKYSFYSLLLVISFSGMIGCTHSTEPIDPVLKDPRTYTWTLDTVYLRTAFQTKMNAVWGSSPNDVYITGRNSDNPGQMYHFNGTKWDEVALYRQNGGYIDIYVDMRAIKGYSPRDIWAVGNAGYKQGNHIIHYDGSKWTTVPFPYSGMGTQLWCIGGTSSKNLFFGGQNTNFAFHYDGSIWRKDSLPIPIPTQIDRGDMFIMHSIEMDRDGNTYAIGDSHYQSGPLPYDEYFFLTFKAGKWNLLDFGDNKTGPFEKWGFNDLWMSPSNTLYSAGVSIFKRENDRWTFLINTQTYIRAISGSSDNNIFAVGDFGRIMHYNGQDWYTLPVFNDPLLSYYDVWTDGREVFIVGIIADYPTKSIVVHGK